MSEEAPLYDRPMPVLFVGHGSPMNAIEDNAWSQGFKGLGADLPRPRAILAVSAHWLTRGTFTCGLEHPKTIHDFAGFPDELFAVSYPAPGDPGLATRAAGLLEFVKASAQMNWGIDHGTWSVLVHMFPEADIPVVQLSLNAPLSLDDHLAIGRALAPLREEGVLILSSGNVVHNLRHAFSQMGRPRPATPPWASAFDEGCASAIERRDGEWLLNALDSRDGREAHPTPDHYLPLLYAFGASRDQDALSFPIAGFDMGSLSMRAVRWG